jgi:hypothetical protein
VAKIANAVLGALGALLVAALSARIFRRRGLAIAAGVLAALHPTLVLVSSDVQSEPLFVVLLLSAGYLLLAATDRPSSNLAVLAGAFLALAALTRSSALMLAPLLLAPLWDGRYPRRASAHIAFSALLGFGLDTLLGDKLGFVNASREVLLQEFYLVLPRDRSIIELVETVDHVLRLGATANIPSVAVTPRNPAG